MPVAFSKEFYTIFQVNKTKYSKIDQVTHYLTNSEGCLAQLLLEPFLNTLSQIFFRKFPSNATSVNNFS